MKRMVLLAVAILVMFIPGLVGTEPAQAQGIETLTGPAFERAFLEQMIMHHQMAVMMAEPVTRQATHDELKTLARTIIEAQTAEIQQMQTWLRDWYSVSAPGPGMTPGMGPGMPSGGTMPGMGPGMMPGTGPGIPSGGMMPGMGPGVPPAGAMPGMGPGMMAGDAMHGMDMMSSLSGGRLEVVFMAMMIPHHEQAIGMAGLALERATHDEVKELALTIILIQTAEIDQMNAWLAAWYGL